MDSYNALLDKAYSELPDKAKEHDVRFEIPVLDIYQQSNKTMIKGFTNLCEKIRREPKYVCKYFSKELAVPVSVEGNNMVLYGKFTIRMVTTKFEKYLKKYVLCPECGKPDSHILEQEGIKLLVCEACGARTSVR